MKFNLTLAIAYLFYMFWVEKAREYLLLAKILAGIVLNLSLHI